MSLLKALVDVGLGLGDKAHGGVVLVNLADVAPHDVPDCHNYDAELY